MSAKLFIISAPSGTGKTSLLQLVMSTVARVAFSVSHTTREPREGEKDGRDYFFVTKQKFQQMIEAQEFLEWALVHDNYYGTALSPVVHQLERDIDVILDIDVQGADIIRKENRLVSTHIFIASPDMAELERRLRGRGTEDEATIRRRLENAEAEMKHCQDYDYFVINDTLEYAAQQVSSIIHAERARDRRTLRGIPVDMELIL